MVRQLLATARAFERRDDGVVAIMFAISFIALCAIAGAAIDFGRGIREAGRLSAALDAAALAGAKAIRLQNMSEAQARALTQRMLAANLAGADDAATALEHVDIRIDTDKSEVRIDARTRVDSRLLQIVGIDELNVSRSATALFESQDIEVALQLDVTGSMSGSRIVDLKNATRKLIDIIIPDTPPKERVRIALAPFSSGINAGVYADAMTGGRASASGSTCVFERRDHADQASDAAPVGPQELRTRNDTAGSVKGCPSATILPLTDNKSLLKATVQSYGVGGWTAGHLGTAMASYLLSPDWASVWPGSARPAPYDTTATVKVAVLMTDGEYNTFDGGFDAARSSAAALASCSAMKANGVRVYTVGFKLDTALAKDVMKSCASGSSNAYLAEDGAALEAAFRDIAEKIVTLRLTN
ncbi:MAG: pilus assembly protein TadG-related protein [Hyphomicrobiaceae bacterium]